MLITDALTALGSKYEKESSINGVKKVISVYTTDKDALECEPDSGAARAVWITAEYGDGEDTYVICTGFDSDGVGTVIDEDSLAEFETEMNETERRALESENAAEYFLALSRKANEEAAEQVRKMERSLNRTMHIGIGLSVGAFVLLIAILILVGILDK